MDIEADLKFLENEKADASRKEVHEVELRPILQRVARWICREKGVPNPTPLQLDKVMSHPPVREYAEKQHAAKKTPNLFF